MPITRTFFYMSPGILNKQSLLIQQNLTFLSKSLVKESPLHGPPAVTLWRVMLRFQSQWFIHSFISLKSPQLKSSPTKWGKHTVTVHRAPHRRKACVQMGCGLVSQGIIGDTAVTTPLPCSLLHDTFHLGLGRPEPC
jgi:hypothetical protein